MWSQVPGPQIGHIKWLFFEKINASEIWWYKSEEAQGKHFLKNNKSKKSKQIFHELIFSNIDGVQQAVIIASKSSTAKNNQDQVGI